MDFLVGLVEGFYGRPWSQSQRLAYADFGSDLGFTAHLHCPKDDPFLRKRWREDWVDDAFADLNALANQYQARGLAWGVGLSPFELYLAYDREARSALKAKVERIRELGGTLLGLLFDDMPGDIADLAQRQAEIAADVLEWASGMRVLVCPTYYSLDPQLERYFGAMPDQYRGRLGEALPGEVEIFWTGPEVCSSSISAEHLAAMRAEFGRKLVLWDNYPVNDGALRSEHLYLSPLADREPEGRAHLHGHFCNPMNQAYLSLPAIAGLAGLYGAAASEAWLSARLGAQTWTHLRENLEEFRDEGLSGMGPERCAELALQYAALQGEAAGEVAAWLRGEYTFDPACLTG